VTDALGVVNAILTAGFEERGKKIATRSYNVLLLITFGMVATLIFSIGNRDHGLCGWLLGLSLVEGMFSALYVYVIRKMFDYSLGYALCAVFFLWIPTEIICVISVILNLVKLQGTAVSETPHGLLIKRVVLIAGLLIMVSPILVLPKIRKEWALSRKAKLMIVYDSSKCYLVIDQEEIRVEMSPKFFWTKKVPHTFMGTKYRDEDESKEDGSCRMERKKDQMKVFCDGELLYEFEVPSYVDLVTLYFPPREA
jgi:hypothetical protein